MIPRRLCGHQRVRVFIGALWLHLTWLGGRTPSMCVCVCVCVCVQQVAGCVTCWKGKGRTERWCSCVDAAPHAASPRDPVLFSSRDLSYGLSWRRQDAKLTGSVGVVYDAWHKNTSSLWLTSIKQTNKQTKTSFITGNLLYLQRGTVRAGGPVTLSKSWKWSLQDANQRQISQKRIKLVKKKTVYLKNIVTHCKRTTNPALLRQKRKKKKKKRQTHTLSFRLIKISTLVLFVFVPAGVSSSTVSSSWFWNQHPCRGIAGFSFKRSGSCFTTCWCEQLHSRSRPSGDDSHADGEFTFPLFSAPPLFLSRSLSRSTPPPPPSGTCRLSNPALSPPRHHYTEPAQSGYCRPVHGWLHHRGLRLNLLYICPHDAPRSAAEPCMSGPHRIRWIILRSLF